MGKYFIDENGNYAAIVNGQRITFSSVEEAIKATSNPNASLANTNIWIVVVFSSTIILMLSAYFFSKCRTYWANGAQNKGDEDSNPDKLKADAMKYITSMHKIQMAVEKKKKELMEMEN